MVESLPTARLAVYIFFEFIALGFALEAVSSLMRGDDWWKWTGALVLGVAFMVLGVKSESIIKRFARYLNSRLVWVLACGVGILYSLYFVQRWDQSLLVNLHQRLHGAIGYAIVALVGAIMACGCWWFTGKMVSPTPAASSSSSPDDDDSQYALLNLSPHQKAEFDKLKAPLFRYKAAMLDRPEYYKLKVLKDEYRTMVESTEKQYGCLIDVDKLECLPKPPATIIENGVDIDISVKMVAEELSKTFFWIIKNDTVKVRVPIVLFISLTNRHTTPLKIDLLYLDAKSVDGWADIRMADSLSAGVQTMSAKPLILEAKNASVSVKGEYLLPTLYDQIIQPGDKVEGWIIAEYPKGFKYGKSIGDMRISLLAGKHWIVSKTFPANPRVYNNELSSAWYFKPLDTLITEDW